MLENSSQDTFSNIIVKWFSNSVYYCINGINVDIYLHIDMDSISMYINMFELLMWIAAICILTHWWMVITYTHPCFKKMRGSSLEFISANYFILRSYKVYMEEDLPTLRYMEGLCLTCGYQRHNDHDLLRHSMYISNFHDWV